MFYPKSILILKKIQNKQKINQMIKKVSLVDMLMLFAAFASLVFSETLYFKGQKEAGLFVGLWVPSILGFAIYLKLIIKEIKND